MTRLCWQYLPSVILTLLLLFFFPECQTDVKGENLTISAWYFVFSLGSFHLNRGALQKQNLAAHLCDSMD